MTAGPVSSRSRSIVPSAPCYACSPAQPAFANSDRSLDQIFPRLQSSRLINTFLRDYPVTPCDLTESIEILDRYLQVHRLRKIYYKLKVDRPIIGMLVR